MNIYDLLNDAPVKERSRAAAGDDSGEALGDAGRFDDDREAAGDTDEDSPIPKFSSLFSDTTGNSNSAAAGWSPLHLLGGIVGVAKGLVKGALLVAALYFLFGVVLPAVVGTWIASEIGTYFGVHPALMFVLNIVAIGLVSRYGWSLFGWGDSANRAWAILALLLAAGALVAMVWRGKDNFQNGEARRYCAATPDGPYCSHQPGHDPKYGLLLKSLSSEDVLRGRLTYEREFFRADPAASDWFDLNTGWPLLFYRRNAANGLEFFSRPGRDPETGKVLSPVSAEIRAEWEAGLKTAENK